MRLSNKSESKDRFNSRLYDFGKYFAMRLSNKSKSKDRFNSRLYDFGKYFAMRLSNKSEAIEIFNSSRLKHISGQERKFLAEK